MNPAKSAPQTMATGKGTSELGDSHGHIGARHDELAMSEIDDAHHAENDREAAGAQHQKRARVAELIEKADNRVEHQICPAGRDEKGPAGRPSRQRFGIAPDGGAASGLSRQAVNS